MYRVVAEVDMFAESFLSPELHGMIAVLVGENIDDVGLQSSRLLPGRFAPGQSQQSHAPHQYIKGMFHGLKQIKCRDYFFSKSLLRIKPSRK